MVTVEKIIAELKIGGYLDAAEYIERQFATINRTAEFGYMKAFIVEGDFSDERYRAQLRALWTPYCLHHNLDVDTAGYDADLNGLWCKIIEVGQLVQPRPLRELHVLPLGVMFRLSVIFLEKYSEKPLTKPRYRGRM